MIFNRYHAQLGMDITENEICIVRTIAQKKQIIIDQQMIVPISPMITDINVEFESLFSILEPLKQTLGYKREPVILALSYEKVFKKTIYLNAALNNFQFEQYIKNSALLLWGRSIDSIYYDYYHLSPVDKNSAIQVIAAQRPDVEVLSQLCNRGGFFLKAIDVDLFSLIRLASVLQNASSATLGFVLVRNKKWQLVVFHHQQFVDSLVLSPTHRQASSLLTSGLQRFEQLHPKLSIDSLFLMQESSDLLCSGQGPEENGIVRPYLNSNIRCAHPLNTRCWTAFALALWGICE